MFLIPTYVAPSGIHGMGAFAAAPVRRGTTLWRLDDDVDWRLTPEEFQALPERVRALAERYCYLDRRGFYVLTGDTTKFMNHAEDPNCGDSGDDEAVARRDIAAGEELTCDYRSFDLGSRSGAIG